jgi:hypothetical protein
MERRVLGPQQVDQAQRYEGGPAEPRLHRRRLDPTGHAVEKDGVRQAGVLNY